MQVGLDLSEKYLGWDGMGWFSHPLRPRQLYSPSPVCCCIIQLLVIAAFIASSLPLVAGVGMTCTGLGPYDVD